MDLAQITVKAHPLHLELLLNALHLLLIGRLDENAGQVALSGVGELGQDLILCAVHRAGMLAVVELLLDLCAELVHRVDLADLLCEVAVQRRQLTDADVDQVDFKNSRLSGQIFDVVVCREGHVDVKALAALVAEDAVLETGDHPAAAKLQGLVLCGTAGEDLAVDGTLVIHVDDVALDSRALVRHQLCGGLTTTLENIVDLLIGDSRSDALGLETSGLGQVQLGLQSSGSRRDKALVLLDADEVIDRVVHSLETVFCHCGVVQSRNIFVHQVVDGVIPEGMFAAVRLDLSAVRLALCKAPDRVGSAGALVHCIGCSFQFLSRCAEGHLADTLFGSFHAYQFHRIYPP